MKIAKTDLSLPKDIAAAIRSKQADQLAARFLKAGIAAYNSEKLGVAASSLRKASMLDPLSATAHYYLANTYGKQRKYQAAVQQYLAVLRLNLKGQVAQYAQEALKVYQVRAIDSRESTVSYCWSGIYPDMSWRCGAPPKGDRQWLKWEMRIIDALAQYMQQQTSTLDQIYHKQVSNDQMFCAVVYFEVTPEGRVKIPTLLQKTKTGYDWLLLDAVRDLSGSNLLSFPEPEKNNVALGICTDFRRLYQMEGCQCGHEWGKLKAVLKTDGISKVPTTETHIPTNERGRLGIGYDSHTWQVVKILAGSGATGKLKVGDQIITIDNQPTSQIMIDHALGPAGGSVKLTVKRGTQFLTVSIRLKDMRLFRQ